MRHLLPHGIRSTMAAWIAVFAIAILPSAFTVHAAPVAVPLKVYKGDSQNVIYLGDYTVDENGPQITETWEYRTPDGNKVRLRKFVYDSGTRRPVSYEDTDLLKKTKLVVTVKEPKITVQMGDLNGKWDTDKTTDLPKGSFIWPVFAHLLAADWDKFVADKAGEQSLYVMSRQDTYGMKVVVEKELTADGIPCQRFSMEPTSFMVRQFAPTAKLIVEKAAPHRVVMFQGNGDLQDPQGNKLDATVVFEWPHS